MKFNENADKIRKQKTVQGEVNETEKYKALVDKLTPEEVEEFRKAFDAADLQKTNNISINQLEDVIRSMGHNPTKQEMKDILALADLDKSGTIDYMEFLTLMALQMKQPFTEEELIAAFELFDLEDGEREGFVDSSLIKQAMIDLLPNTTIEEIEEFIKATDPDPMTGSIDYVKYVKKITAQ